MAAILTYHSIDTPPRGAKMIGLYVTPKMFRFQMNYLRLAGFKVLPLKDLLALVGVGCRDEKLVALTFDDGFMDFYRNAYPVLRRYGYPSTVFIVSELVGRENLWNLRKLGSVRKLMDWKHILEVAANGVTIGSHTRTHPQLVRCSASEMHSEIADSKKDLENSLNQPVEFFCYPYGRFNEAVKEEVRKAGYFGALTTQKGIIEKDFDPFALPRISIRFHRHPLSFMLKLHFGVRKMVSKAK
jgi:peptidoglycan/xylan/chitin deacetylase (PgdA/CDA1 family)